MADLANSGIDTSVVTQNTDGLHQRAGTPADRVIELHGTMHEVICVECGRRSPTAHVIARIDAGEAVPQCLRCGGILKTASTMFGQTMAPQVFARAAQAVMTCDLLLAVGTTLTVEPAGSLCASAVGAGAALVIVNRDSTPYDGIATEIIRDPLSEALPRITRHLLAAPENVRSGRADTMRGAAAGPKDKLLRRQHDLELPAEAVRGAVATAILCGAADQNAALAALGHRDGSLPDELADELVAAVVTPRFLMGLLMETTPEQDRRALTVLARAAATRPRLRVCLTELLSVLPGLSPVAVDVALSSGYPEPLAEALTWLVRNAALPAESLDAIPAGTTVLGEFPVLLAESLVEIYERRAETHPESGPRGLARMLIELAERLADLDHAEEALAVAQRAVEAAGRLTGQLTIPPAPQNRCAGPPD